MKRADIISKIGRKYLKSNIENDEFSYKKGLQAIGKNYVWLKKEVGKFNMLPEEALIVTLDGKGQIFEVLRLVYRTWGDARKIRGSGVQLRNLRGLPVYAEMEYVKPQCAGISHPDCPRLPFPRRGRTAARRGGRSLPYVLAGAAGGGKREVSRNASDRRSLARKRHVFGRRRVRRRDEL